MSEIHSLMRKKSSGRAETEALLLAAAESVFAEQGFGGATTAAIAKRAGLPKSNLHYYFPTKEALYRAVLANVLEAWLAAAASFDRAASAEQALTAYIEAKMDLARQFPLASRIFASEIMRGAPLVQDFLETTLKAWLAQREPIIDGWIAAGQLRPLSAKTLIYMIWATTQHYADFAHQIKTLNGGHDLSTREFDAAKRQVVETILGGILTKRP
ncbi:TetR family transcriptional regulator C-terminal domain-containing protein [Lichenihabitans psoromatis]|uniref:TetR family transcriptional regulator C-terminal domain-containing protein n=1 Tax=Lichenihabitans psoromatis TaxID=2528642 RepID=UPI00103853E2|nr:TetR family transcriptional regulator C-terminal domain-containing protein [Lichenihabitans psoromatis]